MRAKSWFAEAGATFYPKTYADLHTLGKTLKDAKSFFLTPPGTAPPAGPPPFVGIPGIGGVTGISPQQHAWLDMNLTPARADLLLPRPEEGRHPARARGDGQGVHGFVTS